MGASSSRAKLAKLARGALIALNDVLRRVLCAIWPNEAINRHHHASSLSWLGGIALDAKFAKWARLLFARWHRPARRLKRGVICSSRRLLL